LIKTLNSDFLEIEHGLDINSLLELTNRKRESAIKEHSGRTIDRENSVQYFIPPQSFPDFWKILDQVLSEYDLSPYDITNIWTIMGEEGSHHKKHIHSQYAYGGPAANGYAILFYLVLPEDMSDKQGWFFYIDKNKKMQYIKPDLNKCYVFRKNVEHGTFPQAAGLRQTLNIEIGEWE